jgi:polyisoprenoid-binding protein YceI
MKFQPIIFSLTVCLTTLVNIPTQSAESKWHIDPTSSFVQFHLKNMGFPAAGKFTKVTGEVTYDDKHLSESSVQANIDTGSIDTGIAMRDNHLKSKDFFNVAKFPEAEFRSSKIEVQPSGHFKLIGTLSLHGVSQDVILDANPLSEKVDQGGHSHLIASASTTLRRKSFNVGGIAAATIGDTVTIDLAIDMVKN